MCRQFGSTISAFASCALVCSLRSMSSPVKIFASEEGDVDAFTASLPATRPESESGASTASTPLQLQLSKNMMVCVICEQRCRKSHTRWGPCCRKDIEAAEKDASKQGDGHVKAWEEAKAQDETLRLAVLRYKLKCPSKGQGTKRDSMDWVEFWKETERVTTTGERNKGEMMELCEWVKWREHRRGESAPDATKKWLEHEQNSAIDRDNLGENGALRLALKTVQEFWGGQENNVRSKQVKGTKRAKLTEKNADPSQFMTNLGARSEADVAFLGPHAKTFGIGVQVQIDPSAPSPSTPGGTGGQRKKAITGAAAEDVGGTPIGPKKPAAFDIDVERADAKVQSKARINDLVKDLDKFRGNAKAAKEEYEELGEVAWAASMAEHYEIAKIRFQFAEAVASSADVLTKFISQHIGMPPMPKFNELACVQLYRDMVQKLGEGATSEDDLKMAISEVANQEALYTTLNEHLSKCSLNLSRNLKQGQRRSDLAKKKEATDADKAAQKLKEQNRRIGRASRRRSSTWRVSMRPSRAWRQAS